jgi:hypothetical protein
MNPPPKTKQVNKTVIEWLTGTTAKLTALLVAITALLTQVPLVKNAVKSVYCQFTTCNAAPDRQVEVTPQPWIAIEVRHAEQHPTVAGR